MLIAVCKKWHKSSEVDQNVGLKFLLDGLDMLNNFCFHLYAQTSLFILGENGNAYFWTSPRPMSVLIL